MRHCRLHLPFSLILACACSRGEVVGPCICTSCSSKFQDTAAQSTRASPRERTHAALQRGRRCRPRRSCTSCTWTCRCSRRGIASCRKHAGEPGHCAGTFLHSVSAHQRDSLLRALLLANGSSAGSRVSNADAGHATMPYTPCFLQRGIASACKTHPSPHKVSDGLCRNLSECSRLSALMSHCACTGSVTLQLQSHPPPPLLPTAQRMPLLYQASGMQPPLASNTLRAG